jgi:hypothetical protein
MNEFRLEARVQPQIWVNDHAIDSGSSIAFDAAPQMLKLSARQFAAIAEEIIIDNGHDYDELALDAGIVDDWLASNTEATILVTIDSDDLIDWLERIGLTENEGLAMTDELLAKVRRRVMEDMAEEDLEVAAPVGTL